MSGQTKSRIKLAVAAVLVLASVAVVIKLLPWFYSLSDPAVRESLKEYVNSLGVGGVFFMLGIQVLQVVVAVLPGEPVELLAGMIYGMWGGLAVCMAGLLIGTTLVFYLVRALGKDFVERLFSKDKVQKLAFLRDSKKIEMLTFLLFFIPGTPKDILTYVAPLTKIRPRDFLFISIFARIPSVVTSTYAGQTIMDGEWWKTVVMFVLMGVIGIAGILVNNSILEKNNKRKQENK